VIRRRRAILITVLVAAACLAVGRAVSALYVDYEWYAATGAREVWLARATNAVVLTVVMVLVAGLFLFANLYAVRRSIVAVVLPRRVGNIEIGQEVPGRYLTGAAMLISLLLGVGLALPPEPWSEFALARFGVPFGETEPYFQADLGFFVYWLPLESALYVRTLVLLLVTTCAVVVLYFALTPSLRWERNRLTVSSRVRRHAAVLTACIFCALAWSYRLDAYGLLSHGTGPAGAFTYADHHFGIPANRALAVLTVAAGLVTAAALWRGQVRTAFGVVSATILLPLVVFRAVPVFLPHGGDSAQIATHEQPYAVIRALATRQAYGVRRLGPAEAQRGFASRRDAAAGTPAWDPAALTLALDRSAHRHVIPGAVAWERSQAGLLATVVDRGDGGQGAALLHVLAGAADERGGPVRTDSLGRPSLDDQPIPPVLLYDGASGPAIVADSMQRIAAPRIDGWLARLAHAWSAQNLSLIGAELPDPHPKILQRRDVRERVDALVPFFAQGSTVWPAVADDSLYWVLHLYSAADTYPLSEHFELAHDERSYFQHAATAFVHAYTGRVTVVADETLDPIGQTWVRQFPALFTRATELPPHLAADVPPPIDGAVAMAMGFAAIGSRMSPVAEPIVRQRAVVADGSDSAATGDEPPCLALSGGATPCAWSIPLVDAGERVTGLVVAQGGIGGAVRWWPLLASGSGMRWSPALDRLDRAADSALGARHEGTVARGRVRALLVGGQLVLVQPAYEWHADAPPALARVAVATSDSAWSAPTLAEAMTNRSAGGESLPVRMSPELSPADFRSRVGALYDSMRAALKRGDMAAFGAAYASLGRLLGRTP
jgi:uncharacterized membrane protein (UPF0182 family)